MQTGEETAAAHPADRREARAQVTTQDAGVSEDAGKIVLQRSSCAPGNVQLLDAGHDYSVQP